MIGNPFTMVVFIIAIVMSAVVLMVRFKTQAQRGGPRDDAALAALQEEVARLKSRVVVLERIATDKDRMLEQEFQALRDDGPPSLGRRDPHG
jgi:hypothetical protein